MNLTDRFLKYVSFDTQSDEMSGATPSTEKQRDLALYLCNELRQMGLEAELTDQCYLYATLPANTERKIPTIGFIAHMDTSPDVTGTDVHPRIVRNYDGGDILLNEARRVVLSPQQFPELLHYVGQDLIVTDGTTLLGADDKAGIAEIISGVAYLLAHPEIEHGTVRLAFTPDEEIGRGADHFDVEKFGCEWAYTFDGGEVGELEYENFNAASASVRFSGRNVHPGAAKGKMVNALRMAVEFASLVPAEESPECTEGYEGFFFLMDIHGDVEDAMVRYIIRDHDRALFEDRKRRFREWADQLAARYGAERVHMTMSDQYYNMVEKVSEVMHVVDLAKEAIRRAGVEPVVKPIRGGTDGARLSFMGLPCPNIFAGGVNFHGRYEFVPIPSMEAAMRTMVNLVMLVAEK